MKKEWTTRKWLNPAKHADTGAVRAHVEQMHKHVWAYLEIRDCTRTISLAMDFSNETERKQRLRKIRTLRGVLNELETQIETTKLKQA